MHIIQKFKKELSYPVDSLEVESNNPYISQCLFLKLDEVSIQQVSDTVFIVRCYESGKNFPSPHFASMVVVIDSVFYHIFGYVCRSAMVPLFKHNRQFHRFFKNLGLRPSYLRNKHVHSLTD